MIARRLGPDDLEANRAIRLEALAEFPGNYFTSLAEAEARTQDDWRAMLTDPKMAIFGLFDGEALAGLTAIYIADADPSGKTAGFAMSYIRPAWRGQGHAATLHKARLDWAREKGMTRVIVSHRASNAPSARAIARSGFTRTGATPHLWPDGVEEDNVEYELTLD
ncbi:MAG: GNAT family N-acetyltransferase [Sphingomonas sp.]